MKKEEKKSDLVQVLILLNKSEELLFLRDKGVMHIK